MEKKIAKEAYGGIDGKDYQPYVSSQEKIKELTPKIIVVGIILSILFAASNAYASLASGMTVAAGIPGAILGGGLLSIFAKKVNVLNTNITQGMASGGESIASGMTFVLPAIALIGSEVNFITGVIVGIVGTMLGIAITSLVYNYLIVNEHGNIIYPEAMAISETVVSTTTGGEGFKIMTLGGVLGTIITGISSQITGLFSTTVSFYGDKYKYQWITDANPLLVGIGFIVGIEVAGALLAGTILANLAIIPLLGYFLTMLPDSMVAWNNPDIILNQMGAGDIQASYTKYIGAGMMLTGGLIGAIKLIPVIISSIKETFDKKSTTGTNQENGITIPLLVLSIILMLGVSLLISNGLLMILTGFILAILFSFLFTIVSAKMAGDVGTSNLPVSGMTIASLLIITVVFLLLGMITGNEVWTNTQGNVTILLILTTVVTAISTAGGYAQTQKVNFVLGGNKNIVQKMYLLATIIGVIVTVGTVTILSGQIADSTLAAPQANLMASITSGILEGDLPWTMIFVGIFTALVLYILDLPIMTVALGFYLPMGTVTIIFIGAIIKVILDKVNQNNKEELEEKTARGTIFSSGLIAGGAIVGLIGAFLAVFAPGQDMSNYFFYIGKDASTPLITGNGISFMVLVAMCVITFMYINKSSKKRNNG